MIVREFLAKLQEIASINGLLDTPVQSLGMGQCKMDDTAKVYHYLAVNVEGEQLRVFTDYDEVKLTFEDVLNFDYKAVAHEDNERVLSDILKVIPEETKIKCNDTVNAKEFDISFAERDFECKRHGARTVIDVTGDKSEIIITLG